MSSPNRLGTILVIDDHVALAQGFAQALTGAGYTPLVAHSADMALREAKLHHPDAIILDFQMPFINGAGFLYRLREDEHLRQTPVLVITGQTLTGEVLSELQQLGAQIRLKPVGLEDLLNEMSKLVQARPDERDGNSAEELPRI